MSSDLDKCTRCGAYWWPAPSDLNTVCGACRRFDEHQQRKAQAAGNYTIADRAGVVIAQVEHHEIGGRS